MIGVVPGGAAPRGPEDEGFIGVGALAEPRSIAALAFDEIGAALDVDGAGRRAEVAEDSTDGGAACFDTIGSKFM